MGNNYKINGAYFPQWEEDKIETNAPSEHVRWGTGEYCDGIDDVVKSDNARFAALCKKYNFKMPKETKRK